MVIDLSMVSLVYDLINYTEFVCLLWLRVTKPDWEESDKVNTVFLGIYILATFFIRIVPMIVTLVGTAICLGIPVYFVLVYAKKRP